MLHAHADDSSFWLPAKSTPVRTILKWRFIFSSDWEQDLMAWSEEEPGLCGEGGGATG